METNWFGTKKDYTGRHIAKVGGLQPGNQGKLK
jgi:hypothetical protein